LLKKGARRDRLEAKLFGGARMLDGLSDIGGQNAIFARTFLRDEGVSLVAENLGGVCGRRVEFFPTTGRARQIFLPRDAAGIEDRDGPRLNDNGCVELF
jgi:chemotaxis protein CheD